MDAVVRPADVAGGGGERHARSTYPSRPRWPRPKAAAGGLLRGHHALTRRAMGRGPRAREHMCARLAAWLGVPTASDAAACLCTPPTAAVRPRQGCTRPVLGGPAAGGPGRAANGLWDAAPAGPCTLPRP